jgi:hypothetical protein
LLAPLLTSPLQYGRPGQVLQRNWALQQGEQDDAPMWVGAPQRSAISYYYSANPSVMPLRSTFVYDDSANWLAAPVASNPNFLVAPTAPTPFLGWRPTWYSEDSFWQGAPAGSRTLPMLSSGGQPFTPRFAAQTVEDDQPIFMPAPLRSGTVGLYILSLTETGPAQTAFYVPDPPADTLWSAAPTAASMTLLSAAPPAPTVPLWSPPWQAYTDDSAARPAESVGMSVVRKLTVQKVYGLGGQVPPYRWNATLDEPPMHQGAPQSSWTLRALTVGKLFGQGGQVVPYRHDATLDDPAPWMPVNYPNVLNQLLTKIVFTVGSFWRWWPMSHDVDAPGWQGTPTSSNYPLTNPGPPQPKHKGFAWVPFFRQGRRRS